MQKVKFPRVRELLQAEFKKLGSGNRVAIATGFSNNTIAQYLEGRAEITTESFEKLSAYFGKSVAWLRGDTDNDAAPNRTNCDSILDISTLSPEEREMWARCCKLPEERRKIISDVVESLLKAV